MARGRKSKVIIFLNTKEKQKLEAWQRSTTIASGLARRARIILMSCEGYSFTKISLMVGINRRHIYKWVKRFIKKRLAGLIDEPGRGCKPLFPPEVAVHLVKMACERPNLVGRSLSQWDCTELANALMKEGIVESISAETVRKILSNHKLKPWRNHMWLSPKHPRDGEFYSRVTGIISLYTRSLTSNELVLCVDEKTSIQPRPRLQPTKPAHPGNLPNRVEHEYKRAGALNLLAAFDTRTGKVYGQCYDRKRQKEFISFLEYLDLSIPSSITIIRIVCDNVSVHHGREVQKWPTGTLDSTSISLPSIPHGSIRSSSGLASSSENACVLPISNQKRSWRKRSCSISINGTRGLTLSIGPPNPLLK